MEWAFKNYDRFVDFFDSVIQIQIRWYLFQNSWISLWKNFLAIFKHVKFWNNFWYKNQAVPKWLISVTKMQYFGTCLEGKVFKIFFIVFLNAYSSSNNNYWIRKVDIFFWLQDMEIRSRDILKNVFHSLNCSKVALEFGSRIFSSVESIVRFSLAYAEVSLIREIIIFLIARKFYLTRQRPYGI